MSDEKLKLTKDLALPTMDVDCSTLIKWLMICLNQGPELVDHYSLINKKILTYWIEEKKKSHKLPEEHSIGF